MPSDQRAIPRCISLFSGCGGLDLGLQRAGFSIVLGNDNDSRCAESHRKNFRDAPFFDGSVTDLTYELAAELSDGETESEIALLAGGPPCPPYSKSRFYLKDKPRGMKDPVGEGTIHGYIAALRAFRPRAFLLENVHGLAYKVHDSALQTILDAAKDLGYRYRYEVLNAADFGVPQIRQRLFIVGVREGQFEWPSRTHRNPAKEDLLSSGLPPWVTAGAVIGDLDTDENADDTGHFAGGKHHELLKQIPPGANYLFFTEERGHPSPVFKWRSRYWSFLLKLSPEKPSWTIQARRSNNMGPLHWRNRILRIEEVKRLQTFPDDWYLSGTVEQQWRQVGNAVPPLLAERLGHALKAAVAD